MADTPLDLSSPQDFEFRYGAACGLERRDKTVANPVWYPVRSIDYLRMTFTTLRLVADTMEAALKPVA